MASLVTFNADATLGAYEIGVLVSYLLLGVTVTQTYIYYGRFSNDSPKIRALVALVCLWEIAHAICLGHTLYIITISGYAQPERAFGAVPKSLPTAVFLSGVIGASVQGFFSFRIYVLSKKLYIPLLCWAMSFLRVTLAIIVSVPMLHETSVAQYEVQWKWALTALWSVGALNDLTITVTLVVILLRERNNAFRITTAIVDKLIMWTIETGMLTSASSIITLACFVAMMDNYIWSIFFALSSRLISNSFLASLNSRATLRAMDQVNLSLSLSTVNIQILPYASDAKTSRLGYRPMPWKLRNQTMVPVPGSLMIRVEILQRSNYDNPTFNRVSHE